MSSSRKTTYYNLSQFDDHDKPTWRGDYNGDMSKIDTGMQEIKTSAIDAKTAAQNAESSIDEVRRDYLTKTDAKTLAQQVRTTADSALSLAQSNKGDITANHNDFREYRDTTNAKLTTMSGQITSMDSEVAQIRAELAKVEDTGTVCKREHQGVETRTINSSTPEIIMQYAISKHEASWVSYANGLFTVKPGVYLLAVSGRVSQLSADKPLRMYIKRPSGGGDLTYLDYHRESANAQSYTKAEVLIVEDSPVTFGMYTALLEGASSNNFTYKQEEASVALVCLKSHGAPLEHAAQVMSIDAAEEPEPTVTAIPMV